MVLDELVPMLADIPVRIDYGTGEPFHDATCAYVAGFPAGQRALGAKPLRAHPHPGEPVRQGGQVDQSTLDCGTSHAGPEPTTV